MRTIFCAAIVAIGFFVASAALAREPVTPLQSQIVGLVSDIDQRAVLFDERGKAYQILVEGKEVRLFDANSKDQPVAVITFDRVIDRMKDDTAHPGWQYIPSGSGGILFWFVQDRKTILLSFSLRPGRFESKAVEVEGFVYPITFEDGSIGAFLGNPWRLSFNIARVTDSGLVASSSPFVEQQGAVSYVLGSITEKDGNAQIRKAAFANWSNVDTQYITTVSSNGEKRIYTHSNSYAPIGFLPTNEFLMLDVSDCDAAETGGGARKRTDCSSSIVAVPAPLQDGAIDVSQKRVIRKFLSPEILLQTTSPSSLRDSVSIALIGDRLFTVSRIGTVPHLRWTSISDPSRTGLIDLNAMAGDDIVLAMRDSRSGRLALTLDGFLSPLQYFSIKSTGSDDAAPPQVDGNVRVRSATFPSESFHVVLGSAGGAGASSLMVTRRYSPRSSLSCHGRALINVYGGYGITTHSNYLTSYGPFWLDKGNSYIAAYVRGGGDLGEASYRDGKGSNFEASVIDLVAIARDVRKRGCTDVTVMGTSHGGNLAALAALRAPDAVDRAVVISSPLDLERGIREPTFDTDIYPDFADEADRRTFLAQASPLTALGLFNDKKHRKPEFLLFYGGKDQIVPPFHGENFLQKAHDKGLKAKMVVYPGQGHAGPSSIDDYADRMSQILTFIGGAAP